MREENAGRMFFADDGRPNRPKRDSLGLRYAKLLEQHNRNQAKLRRAFRAWEKTNAALKRAEKRLDKLQAEQERGQ